jgi:hypothetical protein
MRNIRRIYVFQKHIADVIQSKKCNMNRDSIALHSAGFTCIGLRDADASDRTD